MIKMTFMRKPSASCSFWLTSVYTGTEQKCVSLLYVTPQQLGKRITSPCFRSVFRDLWLRESIRTNSYFDSGTLLMHCTMTSSSSSWELTNDVCMDLLWRCSFYVGLELDLPLFEFRLASFIAFLTLGKARRL